MDVPWSSSSPNWHTVPSSASNWEHDVFLSFRGEDTRHGFTDHLYFALNQKGIDTFRDTENLPRGKSISPELLKAIEESKFAVIIFSTNYATSSWCLDELAHILECKKLRGLEVLPVFYHVEPSEIRKQTGNYCKAFAKHEERFEDNREKVNQWRKVLKDVADFSGWHVTPERSEGQVIQEITNYVSKAVGLSIPQNHLIGMDSRIREVESRLNLGSNNVLTIGIWGMGGIGKTTLAKEVFKKIRDQFHLSGFVSQVRLQSEVEFLRLLCKSFPGNGNVNIDTVERGIKLLKKALCKNKVLIVLDDVDGFKQIKCLEPGGPLGPDTWGGGSRLIITTRDRSMCSFFFEVPNNRIYEVEKLSDEEAYQLLCQKAFKKGKPPDEFVAMSKRFLQYAGGIPLAHEVLGSYLSEHNNVLGWSQIFHRLDDDKDKAIFSVLQPSYDELQDTDKKIFLDIACFFNGEDRDRVEKILEGCGFSATIGIENLINKSLIKVEINNELWMHNLLLCLGWHIVREESPLPGKRSRLWVDDNEQKYASFDNECSRSWRFEDARNVLEDNTGTSAVEGLFLSFPEKEKMRLNNNDPFLTMNNLRLLKIYNVNFLDVHFTYLSKSLRFLEWHECPLESLPSSFELEKLVELKMPNSCIKQLWNEALSLRMLLLMDLSNCQYLATTPDFSKVPKLERLILEGCTELSEVHPTIGDLQHLVLLNLKGCASLKSLPPSISLRSLRTLILSGCSKLEEFPEIVESMKTLSELYLDGTAIRVLPAASIKHLKSLTLLNQSDCKNLLRLLPSVLCSSLTSLQTLNLSENNFESIPNEIGWLSSLQTLDLSGNYYKGIPDEIGRLSSLQTLDLSRNYFKSIPDEIGHLSSLQTLDLSGNNFESIPDEIGRLSSLQTLNLSGNCISSIPDDIGRLSSLQTLDLSGNFFKSIPDDIGCLSSLHTLNLSRNFFESIPDDIGRLSSLQTLDLSENFIQSIPHYIGCLSSLHTLNLSRNCFKSIPDDIGRLSSLQTLDLSENFFQSIPHYIGRLSSLHTLNLSGNCFKCIPDDIGHLSSLQILDLSRNYFKSIPHDIGRLSSLHTLNLSGNNFEGIPNEIGRLSSQTLDLRSSMWSVMQRPCRMYNSPGLTVHLCSISLLYDQEEDKFQKFITDCWTSFFDRLRLIRQLVDANDDQNVHQRRLHIKDCDRDLIYVQCNFPFQQNSGVVRDFGELGNLPNWGRIEFQLPPSPSLLCAVTKFGALRATFSHYLMDNYSFTCSLHTKKKGS